MGNVMQTAENEVIRREILELCQMAAPVGAGTTVLKVSLRKEGYELTDQEVSLHAAYLVGKGLLKKEEVRNARLNIKREILFITPEGIDYLEGNGPEVEGID